MDTVLALLMSLPSWLHFEAPFEERPFLPRFDFQVRPKNDSDEWLNRAIERSASERDLWYGTPGVRAGEDMLGPVLGLLKRPSGLLEFSPRRIPSYVDPDLDYFNRRYQESETGHKFKAWPVEPGRER